MGIDNQIYNDLFKNATMFLNCSIRYINMGLSEYQNKILSIVNLQMALELAVKAVIVNKFGAITVLQNVNHNITEQELELLYQSNKLKVREFDSLKNFMKSKKIFVFNKPEYLYMERFQKYRNNLVHFNYTFTEIENEQIEEDIIHVLVYILGTLMSEDVNSENRTYMQDCIYMDEYKKLIDHEKYVQALNDFIQLEYGGAYFCPICNHKLMTPDKKCLACLLNFSNKMFYGFFKCKFCHEPMVIYDRLNLECNKNTMRGLCLNCLNDTILYECPECGGIVDLEFPDGCKCRAGYCEVEDAGILIRK